MWEKLSVLVMQQKEILSGRPLHGGFSLLAVDDDLGNLCGRVCVVCLRSIRCVIGTGLDPEAEANGKSKQPELKR